jgi:ADP-ribosylglycohydrolase
MFDEKIVKKLLLASLVADAYSLGAHWVYDEKQLKELDIDWNDLNAPKAMWHKGKGAGDFTHYGDHTLWLYNFVQDKDTFDVDAYMEYWKNKLDSYNGYIDGSTRDTLENISKGTKPTGSGSTDLSIVGRIAPLLLVSNTKEEFLQNVEEFVKCTHNSNEAIVSTKFFAQLLLEVLAGNDIQSSIVKLKDSYDTTIQSYISDGISSKLEDSFKAIREFGPACGIDGGFQGVIHLLSRYDNLKDLLIENAKAGGDSSARAMIASIILTASNDSVIAHIPQNWLKIKATI